MISERNVGAYTPLAFNAPTEGFSCRDDLRKILHEGQQMASVQNGEKMSPNVSTPLNRAHER